MNATFQNLMREATRLTRSGQLSEATQAIRRALQGASQGTRERPARDASTSPGAAVPIAPLPRQSSMILDGCVFEVEEAAACAPAARSAPSAPSTPFIPDVAPNTSEGVTTGKSQGEFTDGSHTHGSLTRRYKLYTPPGSADSAGNVGKGLPLVVMLHGCTQDPDDFAAGTGMNGHAREQGFCVLYPAQSADANPQRCWNWFKHNHQSRGRGEAALLASLTLSVMKQHGIDASRVYIAGLSAGGAMAAIVAAAYPEIYAAVGVHSGLAVGAASNVSEALAAMRSGAKGSMGGGVGLSVGGFKGDGQAGLSRAVPTIVFHGDQDHTVHPLNGEQVSEQVSAAAPRAAGKRVEHGVSSAGRRFTRTVHLRSNATESDAASGTVSGIAGGSVASPAVAEHWLVHGAGHTWSGGNAKGSYTDSAGPDASREMLRFFLEHPMPLQRQH